jgi:hypothetical protein
MSTIARCDRVAKNQSRVARDIERTDSDVMRLRACLTLVTARERCEEKSEVSATLMYVGMFSCTSRPVIRIQMNDHKDLVRGEAMESA